MRARSVSPYNGCASEIVPAASIGTDREQTRPVECSSSRASTLDSTSDRPVGSQTASNSSASRASGPSSPSRASTSSSSGAVVTSGPVSCHTPCWSSSPPVSSAPSTSSRTKSTLPRLADHSESIVLGRDRTAQHEMQERVDTGLVELGEIDAAHARTLPQAGQRRRNRFTGAHGRDEEHEVGVDELGDQDRRGRVEPVQVVDEQDERTVLGLAAELRRDGIEHRDEIAPDVGRVRPAAGARARRAAPTAFLRPQSRARPCGRGGARPTEIRRRAASCRHRRGRTRRIRERADRRASARTARFPRGGRRAATAVERMPELQPPGGYAPCTGRYRKSRSVSMSVRARHGLRGARNCMRLWLRPGPAQRCSPHVCGKTTKVGGGAHDRFSMSVVTVLALVAKRAAAGHVLSIRCS